MKTNVEKIASLAKIGVDASHLKRLERDVPVILSMADTLKDGGTHASAASPVGLGDLRADIPVEHTLPDLSALSQHEKDGFVCVARTVGESC